MKRVLCSLCLLTAGIGLCAGRVRLADDGRARAEIVLAKGANRAARFAALDLKWHLDRMTGGEFKIVTDDCPPTAPCRIFVGESSGTATKASSLKGQESVVDVRADAIELVGIDAPDKGAPVLQLDAEGRLVAEGGWPALTSDKGTTHAVYEFLERIVGVRWTDPSDFGTHLPKDPNLSVPVGRRVVEPFLLYRGGTCIDHMDYSPHVYNKKACDAVEFASVAGGKGTRLARAAGRLFLLRHRAGGRKCTANHSFYHWYDRFWERNEQNPGAWAGARHDWFAQGYPGRPAQLCYSNPEVIAEVVREARDYFDHGGYPKYGKDGKVVRREANWGRDNFALEPMDCDSFCRCPRCVAQYEPSRKTQSSEYSTYWFRFVNAVAREIKKSHPDKSLSTLAYMSHEGLPAGVTLEDNVIVHFCLSANRTLRGQDPAQHPQFLRLAEWRKAYPRQPIGIWFYNGFPEESYRNAGIRGVPGFFAYDAEAEYRFLCAQNARAGVFHCGFSGTVDNYLQLAWMIDPTRRADELLDEYFGPYGAAGRLLRQYYSLVEKRYCTIGNFLKAAPFGAESCWRYVIRDADWQALETLMSAAETVAETPAEKAFVRVWRLSVHDCMKEGREQYVTRSAVPEPEWTARRIAPCGGDLASVPWQDLACTETPLYWRGGTNACAFKASVRLANDGDWLYFEETIFLETAKLWNSPMIVGNDETEVLLALQKAPPYRQWFGGPNGNFSAASFREINWRMNVSWKEHGAAPRFGAKYASDVTRPDRWIMRWAFPLKTSLAQEIGERVYLNATTVLGKQFEPALGPYPMHVAVLTLTPYTSVHTTDRAATVRIEKEAVRSPGTRDVRVRSYVEAKRIVSASRDCSCLLGPKSGQTPEGKFLSGSGIVLDRTNDFVLVDFGRELHGGVAIGCGLKTQAGTPVRVVFGESVGEALSTVGKRGAGLCHSSRDAVLPAPWLGTLEFGNTGFRFVKVELPKGGKLQLESVRAVSLMRPMDVKGSFRCSDERLNEIWKTAARTVHLCSQTYLWDGIKRDRLVWQGDMHPELMAVLHAYGADPVLTESLDYLIEHTKPVDCMNSSPSYSMWFVRCLRDYWYWSGDDAYVRRHAAYLKETLKVLAQYVHPDGSWKYTGIWDKDNGFLDWPTRNNVAGTRAGMQGLYVSAFDAGLELMRRVDDAEGAALCERTLAALRQVHPDPHGSKSAAAILALSGVRTPTEMFAQSLGRDGIRGVTTFYGYYMLEAMSAAGRTDIGLATVRDYWGGMLDMGATSFWEGFDVAWTNNATRVDELPVAGRKDIHGDFGEHCYVGYRHSLCHGWSAGPAAWLIRHVLGIEPLEPGCTRVAVRPELCGLDWAEGALPVPQGRVKVRVENVGGKPKVSVKAPAGVSVVCPGEGPHPTMQ